jgi:hypothetical protein
MMLLNLDGPGIKKLLDRFDKEIEEIKFNCLHMSWFMRGGVTYTDVLNMSVNERQSLNKIIEKNMETTKSSGLPFI